MALYTIETQDKAHDINILGNTVLLEEGKAQIELTDEEAVNVKELGRKYKFKVSKVGGKTKPKPTDDKGKSEDK